MFVYSVLDVSDMSTRVSSMGTASTSSYRVLSVSSAALAPSIPSLTNGSAFCIGSGGFGGCFPSGALSDGCGGEALIFDNSFSRVNILGVGSSLIAIGTEKTALGGAMFSVRNGNIALGSVGVVLSAGFRSISNTTVCIRTSGIGLVGLSIGCIIPCGISTCMVYNRTGR